MFKERGAHSGKTKRSRRKHRSRNRDDDFEELDDFGAPSESDERGQRELDSMDESLLSPDERSYRRATKLADEKVELSRKLVRAGLITIPLLVFLPFLGVIALVVFGMDIGRRAFRLFYEPKLRERFLHEEVHRRVSTRVRDERQSLEGEHHRSLEHLSASIAHEIRNPITAAKSLVQQMGEEPNGADQVEYARVAVAELERVEKSISHLLRFAREEEIQFAEIAMEDVLESAIETFRDRVSRAEVKVLREYDVDGRLQGDSEQLRRVIINLIGNAIDAFDEATTGAREIRLSMGENLAGNEIWVRIADNGGGIDENQIGQIFDPFYTSRKEGTGLGLAMCRKIVDNHEGTIEVESTRGVGTEFILVFPKTKRNDSRLT